MTAFPSPAPLADPHTRVRWVQVRAMLKHLRAHWGPLRVSNHALHALFPRGAPQKQGQRLAGLLRAQGEHGARCQPPKEAR